MTANVLLQLLDQLVLLGNYGLDDIANGQHPDQLIAVVTIATLSFIVRWSFCARP